MNGEIEIRECGTLEELTACVSLQREVFALPEIEISPVRHFVVTKHAGGFTLGAFSEGELVGFVLSVPAILGEQKAFYSHMTAVRAGFQGTGVGRSLKWAQRKRALELGVKFVKWTFEPVKARNAFFNLEKLGAIVADYRENFYGTDYGVSDGPGLSSDRVFAEWHLESEKVESLSRGGMHSESSDATTSISIPHDWAELVATDPASARDELLRVRGEFQTALGEGLVARSFVRDPSDPRYLLYPRND